MKVSTYTEKVKYLSAAFGEPILSANGHNASFSCPVCVKNPKVKKGKKKLSICLDTGMYHCWVCEAKGRNIARFVHNCGLNKNALAEIEKYFGPINSKNKSLEKEIVTLPDDFTLLAYKNTIQAKIAKKYLLSRGLTEEDIHRYKPGISHHNDFINKIIFPSFDADLNLNFFLSRTFDEKQKIKYVNCKANKRDIIFNENMVDFTKRLVLVEGIFDAVKVKDNVCCMLGSWIDEKHLLFQKIVKNKTPVILALDPDAFEKSQKIASKLSQYCIDVKIVDNLSKDLGEMSLDEVQSVLLSAKHYDNTDRLRYLIDGIKSGSMY